MIFTWYGFSEEKKENRKRTCITENRPNLTDINERRKFCMNFDNEARLLTDWQQALTNIHGNNSLTIPGVFVDSHLNWTNTNEKQIFMEQTQILLKEIRSRQGITCDADCKQRTEISVRAVQKQPKILGIHDNISVEEDTALELVCEMFYGFDRSVDPNTQLNWIHNHTTIQHDPDSNISRSDLHDITTRTTLIRTDALMTDSGTYECRYGSSAEPISMPKIVTVLAGK